MTESIHPRDRVRAALRDAILARVLGAVVRRHLLDSAGMSRTMDSAPRLRPHPAIAELLAQIGDAPEAPRPPAPSDADREWLRLPGLFRRWEIEQVIDGERDFHIEGAGYCEDGTSLFDVYARPHEPGEEVR